MSADINNSDVAAAEIEVADREASVDLKHRFSLNGDIDDDVDDENVDDSLQKRQRAARRVADVPYLQELRC